MKKKRIIAFLIDVFSIILVTFTFQALLNISNAGLSSMFFSTLAFFLITCKDCYNGNSIGKYLMKIQILDIKRALPASPLKCVIRNYLYFIWVVELVVFLCSKNGDRLGDCLTKTKVVERVEHLKEINKLNIILTVFCVGLLYALLYIYVYLSVSHTKSLFSLILS